METRDRQSKVTESAFHLRTLTKAGKSRYLSVGAILPADWIAVKVYVEQLSDGVCVLRLVQIK